MDISTHLRPINEFSALNAEKKGSIQMKFSDEANEQWWGKYEWNESEGESKRLSI